MQVTAHKNASQYRQQAGWIRFIRPCLQTLTIPAIAIQQTFL